jgi:phosphoribosylformylglycinamidine synthase subunit PurQ / glutaminase
MSMPRALVVRTAGTNCDAEMCRAFEMAGATVDLVHVDRLIADASQVERFDLIGFPGGFSYGDDIASGRILAMKLREKLYPALRDAARRGCAMIGACNGFQVLVQVGLLPGPSAGGDWPEDAAPAQTTALSFNAGGRFIDAWVRVATVVGSRCIWTQDLDGDRNASRYSSADDVMRLPIAHGEGRFVTASPQVLRELEANGQIALTYVDNPNGSEQNIAGICDSSGRIFGLMPHPERYLDWTLHPFWTRLASDVRQGPTPGLRMFQNAVRAVHSVQA